MVILTTLAYILIPWYGVVVVNTQMLMKCLTLECKHTGKTRRKGMSNEADHQFNLSHCLCNSVLDQREQLCHPPQ